MPLVLHDHDNILDTILMQSIRADFFVCANSWYVDAIDFCLLCLCNLSDS
jgi:hypothetical protein